MSSLLSYTRSAALLLAALLSLVAGRATAATRLNLLVGELASPVFVTHAGDSRLFIVEQAGRIRVFDPSQGTIAATPFLDISSQVASGGERGLLSMAFHPDYASNGLFFVNYTNLAGDTVIARYRVSTNPNLATATSGVVLLLIGQPYENHNGGQLQIGPDGHLYVGMGDGGAGGDPNCNAQSKSSLLGKMLRLDVRANLNTAPHYGIPSDNPFRSNNDPANEIRDEVWAFGLRNPWRFSFDRSSGDLFIADVGENDWEEIDLQRRSEAGGKNFGWRVMEGAHCYQACPGAPACNSAALRLPIYEYNHNTGGCSITGGYVSRGGRAPELRGRYVFGDYCSGRIEALSETSPGVFASQVVAQAPNVVISFGEGSDGRLLLLAGDGLYEILTDAVAVPTGRLAQRMLLALAILLLASWLAWRARSRATPSLAVALLCGFVAYLPSPAAARAFRVAQIPNGPLRGCANCHVNAGGGGPRNVFGVMIENGFLSTPGASGNVLWGPALALLDADADGFTNGQELQDPTGAWTTGQPAPGNPALVTSPALPDPGAVRVPALSTLWKLLLGLTLLLAGLSGRRSRFVGSQRAELGRAPAPHPAHQN